MMRGCLLLKLKVVVVLRNIKGLNNLIKDNNYNNIEVSDYITYIPIYLVSFIVC